MELWDVYDVDRRPTGRTHVRGETLPSGDFHLVVHVCVFNSRGEMLIQRRQSFKEAHPGLWDVTVGGSVVSGESSRVGAARELFEEVGISCDFSNRRPRISIVWSDAFDDFYVIEQETDPTQLQLQYEEVAEVKWATHEEILTLLAEGRFVPHAPQLIDLLFHFHKPKR